MEPISKKKVESKKTSKEEVVVVQETKEATEGHNAKETTDATTSEEVANLQSS